MKLLEGKKISNECCYPGCTERVWYFWNGDPRIYCDEHGGKEAVELSGKERTKKYSQSGSKSFDRIQRNKFRVLRSTLKTVGVEIVMSDFVVEKLSPVVEELRQRRAEVAEQLKPLQLEHSNLDTAVKDVEKTLARMRHAPRNNVTSISRGRSTRTVREQIVDILKEHPGGLQSAQIKEHLGKPPAELSNMRRDGLVDTKDGLWSLTEEAQSV